MNKSLVIIATVLTTLALPSMAQAACNSAQPVTVSVTTAAPDSVTAGNAQGYSYNVGACSTPDHVTLEWVKILDPNAKFDRDPAARQTMTGEISQGMAMSGNGTWTVPATATTGAYAVMVRYYANYGGGLIVNEANAAVKFNVNAAPAPATDVCANVAGIQTTLPGGMMQSGSDCVALPQPTDVCANIAGVQMSVPAGMVQSGSDCITPVIVTDPAVDVCTNLAGMQTAVPSGMIVDASGVCTIKATPQGDPGVARLTLTKVANRSIVTNGQVFTYTLRVKNTGTVAAIKPLLCDTIPGHITVVRAPGAKYSQGRVCWTMSRLAPKGTKTFTLMVRVDENTPLSVKRIVNRATVKATNTNRANAVATVRLRHKPKPQPTGGVTG